MVSIDLGKQEERVSASIVKKATCLGEFLGKLVLVVVDVLGVHRRPLKKPPAEVDQLRAIQRNDQVNKFLAGE